MTARENIKRNWFNLNCWMLWSHLNHKVFHTCPFSQLIMCEKNGSEFVYYSGVCNGLPQKVKWLAFLWNSFLSWSAHSFLDMHIISQLLCLVTNFYLLVNHNLSFVNQTTRACGYCVIKVPVAATSSFVAFPLTYCFPFNLSFYFSLCVLFIYLRWRFALRHLVLDLRKRSSFT